MRPARRGCSEPRSDPRPRSSRLNRPILRDRLSRPEVLALAQNDRLSEVDWIRYRIGRLWTLRRGVIDALTLKAIDDLITEAEQRIESLETKADEE